MRICFALSGLWRIGASAYPGRWRTTQGGASHPGWRFALPWLSHYAPLGRTIRLRIGFDCTLQAIQVVVDYSGWHLPDGPMPQRGGGIAGSLNEAQWFYAPTGRKGIAQGKVTRRPGILPLSRSSPSLSSRLGSPWRTLSTVSLAMPIRGSSDGSFLAFPRATARSVICRRASLVLSRNAVGSNRFANLDVSEADEIGWRFPDVRFQRISEQGGAGLE